MSEQRYLLAIAIGPVQPFIAASRKARDLWAGSELLSDLSRKAAESLRNAGAELIFPPNQSLADGHSVANKLLVSTASDPEDLANNARSKVHDLLREYWRKAYKRVHQLPSGSVDQGLAVKQVDDFVEWYAAWVPYDPSGPDVNGKTTYEMARERVERLLAGRKALRDFWPAHGVDGRPKSSLDPSLESILTATGQKSDEVRRTLHLGKAEQLDAISLVKRLTGVEDDKQSRFVSTSRVAIDPFIRAATSESARNPEAKPVLDELVRLAGILSVTDVAEKFDAALPALKHYRAFPYDCQLFYELSEASACKQLELWEDPEDEHGPLKIAASKFVREVGTLKGQLKDQLGDLPAYYAVLHADGDYMGKALGKLKTSGDHVDFSIELGTFANEVESIVIEHFGAMIYSGGDDVLAFLPLDTAIPCANALRLRFAAIMEEALDGKQVERLPTLSVGLAIGHYAEHLQAILNRARAAEKAAKGPRNALAVAFSAHSGGGDERTVVHSWDDDPLADRWAKAIEFHRHDTLSDGAAYQLDTLRREFAAALKPGAGVFGVGNPLASDDALFSKETLIAEILRILKRKKPRNETKATKETLLKAVKQRLDATSTPEKTLDELGRFVDELIIARRIYHLLLDDESSGARLWTTKDGSPLLAPRAARAMVVAHGEEG